MVAITGFTGPCSGARNMVLDIGLGGFRERVADEIDGVLAGAMSSSPRPFEHDLDALPDAAGSLGLGLPDRCENLQHIRRADLAYGASTDNGKA